MSEKSAMNSDKVEESQKVNLDELKQIKKEVEVLVKPEPQECLVCVTRSHDIYDIFGTSTVSGTSLNDFLSKFAHTDLADVQSNSKFLCKGCFDLICLLEQAELEYFKLKETFDSLISKNPLFEQSTVTNTVVQLEAVKNESSQEAFDNDACDFNDDSEDEPLALTKKKRTPKTDKRKKKTVSVAPGKRKRGRPAKDRQKDSWKCNLCGAIGEKGGPIGEAAHKLAVHDIDNAINNVKKEASTDERSQSPQISNGFDNLLKLEIDEFDDDDSSNYVPDESPDGEDESLSSKKKAFRPKPKDKNVEKIKKSKVMHQCDQCDAKYSSMIRLMHHKQKHEGSKPPYICEVCGAHYKHKKACDIHVALHKGISDWKCEECNKLFPSKGALQRHNNIHTGKCNYQCDLCGKSFIHTSSFKMHKLSHSGVKPHSCDVCGLALMTRSHLKRHKRVHSGEKRHECGVCGKRFSERYNLVAHAKSHEPHEHEAPSTQQPRRRLFRCHFCPDRFERRYMLERHMSVTHGRTLERPPPTPRNTMSKLLKAQAQSHRAPVNATTGAPSENKEDRSPDSRGTPVTVTSQKLLAQLTASGSTSISAGSAWSSVYAAEFGIRSDYPH